MNPKKTSFPLVATALLIGSLALGTPHAEGQTAEQIVSAHIKASGGQEALDRVESMYRAGDILFKSEFTGVLDGTMELVLLPRRGIYQSVDLGAFSRQAGWDGSIGWAIDATGLKELEGDDLKQLRAQSDPFFLARFKPSSSTTVKRLADEDLEGVAHYVLSFSDENLTSLKIYLDQKTHLIAQTTYPVDIPAVGQTIAVSDYWDYETFEGITMPAAVSVTLEGVFSTETTFAKTVLNGEVDETLFALPQ